MEDPPTFKPVIDITGVYDPATAEEGKIYLRLIPPSELQKDDESDEKYVQYLHFVAGVIVLVDHTGNRIEDGIVGSFIRNPAYNMAIDYNPRPNAAPHVNIRRGEKGSMYVDFTYLKPRIGGLFG